MTRRSTDVSATLREVLLSLEYRDFSDGGNDGRRSIYHKSGHLETRATAKEAWEWLRSIGYPFDCH
jgi:hypothetical protein